MSDKLTMTAEEILNNLVIDYLEYDLGINTSDYEPFSDFAGVILHRIIEMDKKYKTDAELSDAYPVRPVDMYERRIAVLERENQRLKIELEQSRNVEDTTMGKSLFEKLNDEADIAYDKWFERWYKSLNLEKEIEVAWNNGFGAYGLNIKKFYESESNWDDKRKYTARRARDERTVKNIQDKLGDGFKVKYCLDSEETTFFGMRSVRQCEYILISWAKG